MNNPLSFACELIEAIPEAASLYLANSDLLIPNKRWTRGVGPTSRLRDLEMLDLAVEELRVRMRAMEEDPSLGEWTVPLDDQRIKSLVFAKVPDQPNMFFFLLRDETEARRLEQLRKDFIANVSHELRTPLTAVRGYVETLLDPNFLTIERVREFLPIIFEHTERLHNLVLDLLSLSRLEDPKTHIEVGPMSLADEIQEAVAATMPLARMKSLHIEVDTPPDSWLVRANSEHLQRILVNLLDNAIKYSKREGRVRIWSEIRDGFAWTHVRDEGQGIAAEDQQRIFERFYRTKGALGGRVRGSGLGLAIVKHIVQQLEGEIHVSSAVGEGSDFFFGLPMALTGDPPGLG